MKKHARFVTEDGEKVELDYWIEVEDHLTGELYPAHKATPDMAIVIPTSLRLFKKEKLALRDDGEYRRFVKKGMN